MQSQNTDNMDIAKEHCRALFTFTFIGALTLLLSILSEQFVPLPFQFLLFAAATILKKSHVLNLIKPESIQHTAGVLLQVNLRNQRKITTVLP